MYNKKEIEKNLKLFTSSLDEIFTKIALNPYDKILYERAETTLELAEYVKASLSRFKDKYIKDAIKTIDSYALHYSVIDQRKYQKEMLKTHAFIF